MSAKPTTKLMRFGEWFDLHQWDYSMTVEFTVPVSVTQGGAETEVTFRKQALQVIPTFNLVRVFKDYDQYLDDNLVL